MRHDMASTLNAWPFTVALIAKNKRHQYISDLLRLDASKRRAEVDHNFLHIYAPVYRYHYADEPSQAPPLHVPQSMNEMTAPLISHQ